MDVLDEVLKQLKIKGAATVLHKPNAVRLDGFPLLAYSPGQWGQGVRTEDRGILVADLCVALAGTPDFEAIATRFGTTVEHVRQAADYGVKTGFIGS